MIRGVAIVIAVITLAGCGTIPSASSKERSVGQCSYSTPTGGWKQYGMLQARRMSLHGPTLQEISVYWVPWADLEVHRWPIHVTRAANRIDLAQRLIGSLADDLSWTPGTVERIAPLAGGFSIEVSSPSDDGLPYRTVIVAKEIASGLCVARYTAPTLFHFEQYLPAFETVSRSLTGR